MIAMIHQPRSAVVEWLEEAQAKCRLRINPVIFAEISPNFASFDEAVNFLADVGIAIEPLALLDCHRAGLAFAEYRRRGGERKTILPDFLIGAQAAERGWPLVTRDRKGFASYFPELELIDPLEENS